ncbi:TadG family pilus assembly protein [Caballeronia hypogeia]|nr:TadG family pilus assembly protein [Caballeronia hypogeia]
MRQGSNTLRVRRSSGPGTILRRQRGAIALSMPFMLITALAAGAFAVDIGHLFYVRTELQTAADAAALAGAAKLLPGSISGPNWSAAQLAATNAMGLNKSEGATLHDASVQAGYWNLTGTPAVIEATTILPGSYDAPSVQVSVSRAPGLNGGPVSYFLAPLFGMNNGPVKATAVATVSAPGSVAAGGLFPMEIGSCIYTYYWDVRTGMPRNDPATGAPYTVYIGDVSNPLTQVNGCQTGQWTGFQTGVQNVPDVEGLIVSGNPQALGIGDSISIASGDMTTIYPYVRNRYKAGTTVVMPVVYDATSSPQNILAFTAFHIDTALGGSSKYIKGHFVGGYPITTAGNEQVGPYYGAYLPPRLAR